MWKYINIKGDDDGTYIGSIVADIIATARVCWLKTVDNKSSFFPRRTSKKGNKKHE